MQFRQDNWRFLVPFLWGTTGMAIGLAIGQFLGWV